MAFNHFHSTLFYTTPAPVICNYHALYLCVVSSCFLLPLPSQAMTTEPIVNVEKFILHCGANSPPSVPPSPIYPAPRIPWQPTTPPCAPPCMPSHPPEMRYSLNDSTSTSTSPSMDEDSTTTTFYSADHDANDTMAEVASFTSTHDGAIPSVIGLYYNSPSLTTPNTILVGTNSPFIASMGPHLDPTTLPSPSFHHSSLSPHDDHSSSHPLPAPGRWRLAYWRQHRPSGCHPY
jgi:hypothetical protein